MTEARTLAREVLIAHPAAPTIQEKSFDYAEAVRRATDSQFAADVLGEMARMTLMSLARLAAAREVSREAALRELFSELDRLQEAFDDVDLDAAKGPPFSQ
jgi:hypothetical protein